MNLSLYCEIEIAKLLRKHKIVLKKSLGQNLLLDLDACKKIASTVSLEDEVVIEIGPGVGNLTQSILQNKPKQLIVIEKDSTLKSVLSQLESKSSILRVEYADAMHTSLSLFTSNPVHIFGNLPYNISTQLIFKWIEEISLIKSLTLTLQSEVADRICSSPGTKNYGKLGILCQLFFTCSEVIKLKPELFFPVPCVHSTTVHMIPKIHILDKELIQNIKIITSIAFAQRRKMLRQSLKPAFHSPINACIATNIDSTIRAEDVTIEQYVHLAKYLRDSESKNSQSNKN
jgi:16S rRNA (adenine1518-N6/adenine1519-N6)-dimethyltransferase